MKNAVGFFIREKNAFCEKCGPTEHVYLIKCAMVDYLQPRPILLITKAKNVQVTGINAVKLQNKLEPMLPLLELKSKRFDHPIVD